MNKKILWAFLLLGLTMLVLVFNSYGSGGGRITLHLIFTSISALKSLIFFAFIVVGVLIGVLIK